MQTEKLNGPALRILKTETITPIEAALPNHAKEGWSNLSLLERSAILHEALSYLDEETTDEEFEIIAETEDKFKEKLIACGYVAQKWDQAAEAILSEAQALKEQIKALEERAHVFSNRAAKRREVMLHAMLEHNLKKVETPMLTVSLRKRPPRVVPTTATLNGFDPTQAYTFLLDACEKMLDITGGSDHWQGETHEALQLIEDAIEHCADILPEYLRLKAEFNRKSILNDLKQDKAVPGFQLSNPEFSVSIK